MLSRTADHLFWMARYIERAENTSRMLDVNIQTNLLPKENQSHADSWQVMLTICELETLYHEHHDQLTDESVLHFMVADPNNPSSIYNCFRAARENARAVRGTLTTEVWETVNTTWLDLKKMIDSGLPKKDPGEFFEWVKFRSHLSRGVSIGTMLKDDAFRFTRVGTFLERADNTARLLDVKFHDNTSSTPIQTNQEIHTNYYQWAAVLRSLSAFETYRKVYRGVISAEKIAEFMILRGDMPRSLLGCLNGICSNLEQIRGSSTQKTEVLANQLREELDQLQLKDMFGNGLHPYLDNFLERVNKIGSQISQDVLVPID